MQGLLPERILTAPFAAAYSGNDNAGKSTRKSFQVYQQGTTHGLMAKAALVDGDPSVKKNISFNEGFSALNSAGVRSADSSDLAGGLPRAALNQFGYVCTYGAFVRQHGRVPEYSSKVVQAIGGYPKGAVLRYRKPYYIGGETEVLWFCYDVISVQDDNDMDFTTGDYVVGTPDEDGKTWWKFLLARKPVGGMPCLLPDLTALKKTMAYTSYTSQRILPVAQNFIMSDTLYNPSTGTEMEEYKTAYAMPGADTALSVCGQKYDLIPVPTEYAVKIPMDNNSTVVTLAKG